MNLGPPISRCGSQSTEPLSSSPLIIYNKRMYEVDQYKALCQLLRIEIERLDSVYSRAAHILLGGEKIYWKGTFK